jgi:hypothetical protein
MYTSQHRTKVPDSTILQTPLPHPIPSSSRHSRAEAQEEEASSSRHGRQSTTGADRYLLINVGQRLGQPLLLLVSIHRHREIIKGKRQSLMLDSTTVTVTINLLKRK